jgi:hypothetical protein
VPCGWPGCSAIKARTQAANQLGGLIISAPNVLRAELRVVPTVARVDNAASFQPQDKLSDPTLGGRDARGRVPGPAAPPGIPWRPCPLEILRAQVHEVLR